MWWTKGNSEKNLFSFWKKFVFVLFFFKLFIKASGWVIYRARETMKLPQQGQFSVQAKTLRTPKLNSDCFRTKVILDEMLDGKFAIAFVYWVCSEERELDQRFVIWPALQKIFFNFSFLSLERNNFQWKRLRQNFVAAMQFSYKVW